MQVLSELIAGVRGAELGSATIYRRATSTEATVYADYDGTVALAQPLTLDSYGGVECYVNEEVDVRVADEDGVVIRAFSPMHSANSVEYVGPSFRGARYSDALAGVNQPTTVQAILDKWITSAGMPDFNVDVGGVETSIENALGAIAGIFINVKAPAYGAVGDGVADDTTAVQAALDAAAVTKGIVWFPAGLYKITATLTVAAGVTLWGSGPYSAILVLAHATADLLEYGAGSASGFQEIRGLLLVALTAATGKFISITAVASRSLRMVNSAVSDGTGHTGNQIVIGAGSECTLEVDSCFFGFSAQTLNAGCISASNANSNIVLLNTTFIAAGAMTASNFLVGCRRLKSVGCVYDMSLISSGTYFGIILTATSFAAIVGNEFIPGAGTSGAMALTSDVAATRVMESANMVRSGFTTTYSGFNASANNPQILRGSREAAVRAVTSNATPLALEGNLNSTVFVTRSAAGAQAFTSVVGPAGARLTVVVGNAAGVALAANPTFSTGFYIGTPALTAPTNGKVSIASFVSVYDGGTTAWYPEGAYVTDI